MYVCELCKENGKCIESVPTIENDKLQETTSSLAELEEAVSASAHCPCRNGKVCKLLFFQLLSLITYNICSCLVDKTLSNYFSLTSPVLIEVLLPWKMPKIPYYL